MHKSLNYELRITDRIGDYQIRSIYIYHYKGMKWFNGGGIP